MAMEFKVGDLVAAKQHTSSGNVDYVGMIIERTALTWKVEWFGFHVDIPYYSSNDMAIFRDNYITLRQKLNL